MKLYTIDNNRELNARWHDRNIKGLIGEIIHMKWTVDVEARATIRGEHSQQRGQPRVSSSWWQPQRCTIRAALHVGPSAWLMSRSRAWQMRQFFFLKPTSHAYTYALILNSSERVCSREHGIHQAQKDIVWKIRLHAVYSRESFVALHILFLFAYSALLEKKTLNRAIRLLCVVLNKHTEFKRAKLRQGLFVFVFFSFWNMVPFLSSKLIDFRAHLLGSAFFYLYDAFTKNVISKVIL